MVGGIEVTNMHHLTDTPFALRGVVAYSPCCFVQLLEKAMEREREREILGIYIIYVESRDVYNKPQKRSAVTNLYVPIFVGLSG